MYAAGTILKKREQREPDEETGEPFAYNEVEVIGRSPVNHLRGDWDGEDAQGVIIKPRSNFGGVLDEPFGKVREMYEVIFEPEIEYEVTQKIRVVDAQSRQAGPTPEDIFAEAAPGVAPEPGQVRGRTSPLGDAGGPKDKDGPLGPAPSRRKKAS